MKSLLDHQKSVIFKRKTAFSSKRSSNRLKEKIFLLEKMCCHSNDMTFYQLVFFDINSHFKLVTNDTPFIQINICASLMYNKKTPKSNLNKIEFHLWKTILFVLFNHFGLLLCSTFFWSIWMHFQHTKSGRERERHMLNEMNKKKFHQQSLIFMIRIHFIELNKHTNTLHTHDTNAPSEIGFDFTIEMVLKCSHIEFWFCRDVIVCALFKWDRLCEQCLVQKHDDHQTDRTLCTTETPIINMVNVVAS